MAASPGKLLFGKALSCAISVVKAGHVQGGATKLCVQRVISVFMATNRPLWQINLLPFCLSVSFEEMILPRLKCNILVHVVFCKSIAAGVYLKKALYSWLV